MKQVPVVLATILAASTASAGTFPKDVPLPTLAKVNQDTLSERNHDELVSAPVSKKAARGHLVRTYLSYVPEGSAPSAATVWTAWKPLLVAAGWKSTGDAENLHVLSKGSELLKIALGDFQEPLVEIITDASRPTTLKLVAPAAKPESVSDTQDYPWLPAFPGAKLESTGPQNVPLIVTRPGEKEDLVVAHSSIIKYYTPPPTLSKLETYASFSTALKAAGWDVLPATDTEGKVTAHYAKNGRNIWLVVGRAADDSNTGLSYVVADVGADDWSKQLDQDCKLQLVGVHFDFDKATLKSDSTPVLTKAAALLAARPKMKFEISGHTDNVGNDAYNEKLSQSRAESVVAWLTAHKIPKGQLVAKGYGKKQPIADNESAEGRAQNRRVQLSCVK